MGGRHWTFTEVQELFKTHGYELLESVYRDAETPLLYRCSCGETRRMNFRNFRFDGCPPCHSCCQRIKREKCRKSMTNPETLERRRQTFQRNYGVDSPLQNAEVRKKRENTCQERYGVKSVSQDPAISKRQREGFRNKYGVDHFLHNPASLAKYRKTMIERYGAPSLAFVSRRSSKEAQEFFLALYALLPQGLQEHCYFSPLTHEFNVWKDREYFKYDFVHSGLKCCIEYNGSRFHPRPDQRDEETGWCLFRPTRTVKEAREYESRKLGALTARGFRVLVVWDKEVQANPQDVFQRCLAFLTPKTP